MPPAFDKAAYWAQKGQPRPKGRLATVTCCGNCRGTKGTVDGRFFLCAKEDCRRKLLADTVAAAAAGRAPEGVDVSAPTLGAPPA